MKPHYPAQTRSAKGTKVEKPGKKATLPKKSRSIAVGKLYPGKTRSAGVGKVA